MKIKVTFVIVLSLESNGHDYTSPDLDHQAVSIIQHNNPSQRVELDEKSEMMMD